MTNRDKVVRAAYEAGYARGFDDGDPFGTLELLPSVSADMGWQKWIDKNRHLVDRGLSRPEAVREAMLELESMTLRGGRDSATYKTILRRLQDAIRAKTEEANRQIVSQATAKETP